MIEKGGHYTRHYMTPAANPPRPTLRDQLRGLVYRTFYPGIPEGRRRIIPGMPCDNHALGWTEPVYPAGWQKKTCDVASTTGQAESDDKIRDDYTTRKERLQE